MYTCTLVTQSTQGSSNVEVCHKVSENGSSSSSHKLSLHLILSSLPRLSSRHSDSLDVQEKLR